jgi:hypothetical protein
VEQELLTLPGHLSSSPAFSGVRRSLVLCVCFVDICLSFCHFSFGLKTLLEHVRLALMCLSNVDYIRLRNAIIT